MSKLRVLIVDDNADDRCLVLRELRRDHPGLEALEVSDAEGLESALAAGDFDLVITDYHLYWSDGLEVLRRVKAGHPDVAVLMFTGTGNEEVAVEAMKRGVDDYVLKSPSHFGRLTAAVKKCLSSLKRRRELNRAETRYKELFDTVPVGLFRCTPAGGIQDANPALANLIGCTRERLLTMNMTDLHAARADYLKWRSVLERHGAVAFIESQFKTLEGENRWVEIHAKALRDPANEQIYYEGSVEDITQRKQAEVERERLIEELREALSKVKLLAGFLPICAGCKKIRDKQGDWNDLEPYIESHSEAEFTHGFCPECAQRLYPELMVDIQKS
jgi:PAS domain S-box-containing protein